MLNFAKIESGHLKVELAPFPLHEVVEGMRDFVQVDRRYKREQEGIGLGLAISRELARAMGGDLVARSVEGEGSVFELSLPSA